MERAEKCPYPVPASSLRSRRWVTGLLILLIGTLAAAGQPEETDTISVRTNLQIIRSLAGSIGKEISGIIGKSPPARLAVSIVPRERAWLIEPPLLTGLTGSGGILLTSENPTHTAEIGIGSLRVAYAEPRKSGLIGSTVVDRTVVVELSVTVTASGSGEIPLTNTFVRSARDTLELSGIPAVENPNIPETKGEIPAQGFFSNIAEPLIVLGAVAVAVFLLFHVRS